MPTYQITGKNGVIYRIDGPAGLKREQVIAAVLKQAPEAGVAPQEENTLEKIPFVGDALAAVADIPLGVVGGLAGVGKSFTDVFGAGNAASEFLGNVSEGAQDWQSSESRADALANAIDMAQAEGKGTWEEVKSAGRSFLRSPLDTTAQVAGSALPFIAAGVATGGAGTLASIGSMAGLGALSGAGTIKGTIYDTVKKSATEAGVPEEQASAIAEQSQEYDSENLDQIGLGAAIGAAASATGLPRQISAAIAKKAATEVIEETAKQVARKSVLAGTAKGALEEAVPEAIQGGQEALAGNIAAQRAGYGKGDVWSGVAGQAALEGISSLLLGGYGGHAETMAENENAVLDAVQEEVADLPVNPSDEQISDLKTRLVEVRGFPEQIAQRVADRVAAERAALAGQEKLKAARRQEAVAERTAGITPEDVYVDPNINAPMPPEGGFTPAPEPTAPPVDEEEQVARYAAYAPDTGIIPPAEVFDPEAQFAEQLGMAPAALSEPPVIEQPPVRGPAPTIKADQPISPFRAEQVLNNPSLFSDFMARFGMDEGEARETLYGVMEGEPTNLRFSRRGRPAKDTETPSLFGEMATQVAPGEELKREEFNQFRFAPEEEKARMREEAAQAEIEAREQAGLRAKELDAEREETLGDIEYALRAQDKANAPYKVVYNPEDVKAPYKLVAERTLGDPNPVPVLTARSLPEFSDAVYSRMMDLTPFNPAAVGADEAIEDTLSAEEVKANEGPERTPYNRMVQDFTDEIDTAREQGLIDNLQRAELLRRFERPNAYRMDRDGKRTIPNDAIAKLEAEFIDARSALTNADVDTRPEAQKQFIAAEQRLRAAVQNSLINPARAALKSMSEMRQDERLGAKVRVKEAKGKLKAIDDFQKQSVERGQGVLGPDTNAELDYVEGMEAQRELRNAKIDLKETKVQKYRRKTDGPVPTGTTAKQVRKVVNKVVSKWKGNQAVTVVQSIRDITDKKLLAAILQDGATDAEGFVAPDGTIYLIADNLADESRAKAVLFHEGLGHVGLTKAFRDGLDNLLVTMYRGNAKLKADTDKWRQANPDAYARDANPLARAVEEVLAERSEAGKIERSLFQRLVSFVRDFARRLGMGLSISDADVNAILATAHDQVANGVSASSAMKGMRYVAGAAKYSRKQTKGQKAYATNEADVSIGLRRAERSNDVNGIASGIEEAVKARSVEPAIELLKEIPAAAAPATLKGTLYSLPTSGILDWFGKDIPALKRIDKLIHNMSNMKVNIAKAADPIAKRLQKFLVDDDGNQLAKTQITFRINELEAGEFASVEEALQNHGVVKAVEALIRKNANNKQLADQIIAEVKALVMAKKSLVEEKGDKVKPTQVVIDLTNKLTRDAKDGTVTSGHVEQLAEITRRIRDSYAEWDKLGKMKGGQQLYKDMRQFYKDMFEAELALLDARIEGLFGEDENGKKMAQRLKDKRAEMMRAALTPEERRKQGDIFADIDPNLFSKDYFPFMREGKYWLRVTAAKNGIREKEFYQFDTALERNRAWKAVAKRLGVDPEKSGDILKIGNDVNELQEELKDADLIMQQVFDLMGTTKATVEDRGFATSKDFLELSDAIYQTWLLSTPERSVRRRFMHSENVTGMQQDLLRQFSNQVTAYSNQLSKMAYAGDVRKEVKGARENVSAANDRTVSEQAKLNTVISEIEARAEQEINPDPQSAIVNMLNRASYFYYLTSAATALVNLTSIPIRVLPRMWREYGFARGNAKYIQYMRVWKTLGNTRVVKEKSGIGDELHAIMPDINGSSIVNAKTKRGELLRRARKAGMESNILETVTDTLVQNERETTKKNRKGVSRMVANGATEAANIMSVLFQGTENISRQAAYYMNFELAYDTFLEKNPGKEEEAFEHAVSKAMEATRDTLGDYSNFERPRLAKGNWSRALFLFKMYPIVQTKFMVGAVRDIWKGKAALIGKATPEAKAEAVGALKELMGVTMMAGVFGGIAGMPLYSLLAWALADSFDEEDDEDVRKLMGLGDIRNAYDSDTMFRKWIMDTIGSQQIGDVNLAEAVINGPVSAITNTDLTSRTSLDIKNMWFRESVAGDSTWQTIMNTVLANVAGGQMIANLVSAGDLMADGDMGGALKKALPAFARTWVTAAIQGEEGVKDRKGNTIIRRDELNEFDQIRTVLGFRSLGLSRWQDYYITAAKNEDAIMSERDDIFNEFDRMRREGEMNNVQDLSKFYKERVLPFNRTYPHETFVIEIADLVKSARSRDKVRSMTVRGMRVTKTGGQEQVNMARQFMP